MVNIDHIQIPISFGRIQAFLEELSCQQGIQIDRQMDGQTDGRIDGLDLRSLNKVW